MVFCYGSPRRPIYTDVRYTFGVLQNFGMLWKHRRFLTSAGTPINIGQAKKLSDAILNITPKGSYYED